MKKAILIIITLGMILVGGAFYYAESSITLHREYNREMSWFEYRDNEVSKLENRIKSLEDVDQQQYQYESIELSQTNYIRVNNCVQNYLSKNELPNDCKEDIVNILINEYGEVDFIESIIGHFRPQSFSFNRVLQDLFKDENSLKEKLILHFLEKYRNPQNLQEDFNAYKNHFYNKIPKSLYDKIFRKKVTALLNAYKKIESQDDKEAYFKEIYFRAESQRLHFDYWETTFWKRRELEKNDKTIYNILTEIEEHYKE